MRIAVSREQIAQRARELLASTCVLNLDRITFSIDRNLYAGSLAGFARMMHTCVCVCTHTHAHTHTPVLCTNYSCKFSTRVLNLAHVTQLYTAVHTAVSGRLRY